MQAPDSHSDADKPEETPALEAVRWGAGVLSDDWHLQKQRLLFTERDDCSSVE